MQIMPRMRSEHLPGVPRGAQDHRDQDRYSALGDLRFRSLLPDRDWETLPAAVRRRFSTRVAGGESVVYVGEVTEASRNLVGRLLAECLRLAGAPLPLSSETGLPSIVSVTEDVAGGGQNWTRVQCTRRGFPQVVHSAKRFTGPTGLEEFLSRAISVSLRVCAEERALVFRSDHIALHLGNRRLRLPSLLSPGDLTVRHEELGNGRFRFSMTLAHRWFGTLIHQAGIYREEKR